jgi:hypothetical protein
MGDGVTCQDVDECTTNNGGCDANARCTNTPGSRTCACNTGYAGTGLACSDVNECLTGNGGCSSNATCTNTPGSRTCACNAGFTGNGVTCTPTATGGGGAATGGGGGTTGGGGGTTGGGPPTGGGGGTTATTIDGVRAAIALGTTSFSLSVSNVVVTAFKPAVSAASTDAPGFFVQSTQTSPGLFIQVDPNTIPNLAVGDLIDFTALSGGKPSSLSVVYTISNVTRRTPPTDLLPGLTANASGVNFTVAANVDAWESRLAQLRATLSSDVSSAGAGYSGALLTTAGTSSGFTLRLRMPTTAMSALNLSSGCVVDLPRVPFWRFGSTGQPSAFTASQVQVVSCPGPSVVTAGTPSLNSVLVAFDKELTSATVSPAAFLVLSSGGNAVTVSSASLASPRIVLLGTSSMSAGISHTVTVANTVTSLRGDPMTTQNGTVFTPAAANTCTAPQVVISQVYVHGGTTWSQDFVELHNRGSGAIALGDWSVQYQSGGGSSWTVGTLPSVVLQGGAHFLVAMGSVGTTGSLLSADFTVPNITLSSASGKVALVNSSTALSSGCPGNWVDLVAYGTTTTTCNELSNAPGTTAGSALQRGGSGCSDTNNNGTDFTVTTPNPRNTSTSPLACSCP